MSVIPFFGIYVHIKTCLHIQAPSLGPSQSLSEVNIVPREMDPICRSNGLSPFTQCEFYGDCDGHCYGDGDSNNTSKQALRKIVMRIPLDFTSYLYFSGNATWKISTREDTFWGLVSINPISHVDDLT